MLNHCSVNNSQEIILVSLLWHYWKLNQYPVKLGNVIVWVNKALNQWGKERWCKYEAWCWVMIKLQCSRLHQWCRWSGICLCLSWAALIRGGDVCAHRVDITPTCHQHPPTGVSSGVLRPTSDKTHNHTPTQRFSQLRAEQYMIQKQYSSTLFSDVRELRW